jgi:hypothetical protein
MFNCTMCGTVLDLNELEVWESGETFCKDCVEPAHSAKAAVAAAITAQRLARDAQWRAANAAAAAKRAQSTGWRLALNKRAQNATWRRLESIARAPILHARWHVKRGLVPLDTAVENCDFCKAVAQRRTHDERTELPEILEPLPPSRIEDALDDIVERVNRMFERN